MERDVTNLLNHSLEYNDLASFLLKQVSQTLLDSLGFLSFCEGNILGSIVSKLHNGYYIDWTPIIGDNQFSYPEISFSTNSQDFKSEFSGVMCTLSKSRATVASQ